MQENAHDQLAARRERRVICGCTGGPGRVVYQKASVEIREIFCIKAVLDAPLQVVAAQRCQLQGRVRDVIEDQGYCGVFGSSTLRAKATFTAGRSKSGRAKRWLNLSRIQIDCSIGRFIEFFWSFERSSIAIKLPF